MSVCTLSEWNRRGIFPHNKTAVFISAAIVFILLWATIASTSSPANLFLRPSLGIVAQPSAIVLASPHWQLHQQNAHVPLGGLSFDDAEKEDPAKLVQPADIATSPQVSLAVSWSAMALTLMVPLIALVKWVTAKYWTKGGILQPLLCTMPGTEPISIAAWTSQVNQITLFGEVVSDPVMWNYSDTHGNPGTGIFFDLVTRDGFSSGGLDEEFLHRIMVTNAQLIPVVQAHIRDGVSAWVEGTLEYYKDAEQGQLHKVVLGDYNSKLIPGAIGAPAAAPCKVQLLGTVGGPPTLKQYIDRNNNAKNLVELSLAVNDPVSKQPTWHKVTFYNSNRVVEYISSKVHQGDTVLIEGQLRYNIYVDKKDGKQKQALNVTGKSLIQHTPKGNGSSFPPSQGQQIPEMENFSAMYGQQPQPQYQQQQQQYASSYGSTAPFPNSSAPPQQPFPHAPPPQSPQQPPQQRQPSPGFYQTQQAQYDQQFQYAQQPHHPQQPQAVQPAYNAQQSQPPQQPFPAQRSRRSSPPQPSQQTFNTQPPQPGFNSQPPQQNYGPQPMQQDYSTPFPAQPSYPSHMSQQQQLQQPPSNQGFVNQAHPMSTHLPPSRGPAVQPAGPHGVPPMPYGPPAGFQSIPIDPTAEPWLSDDASAPQQFQSPVFGPDVDVRTLQGHQY